jgi:sugar (pentulose or hexulose) kinase
MTITLGIDVGTTAAKCVLFSGNQIIAQSQSALMLEHPRTGWCEQDPTQWIEATTASLAALRVDKPKAFAVVSAITGKLHGAVLLDRNDKLADMNVRASKVRRRHHNPRADFAHFKCPDSGAA